MAKRKTPKSDKIIDLKPRAEKVTDEQLEQLRKLVGGYNQIQNQIGELEITKHRMFNNISQVNGAISSLREELISEYGCEDISIADGSLKYKEDEQADS